MRRYRKSTWGLIIWTGLMGLWLVSWLAEVSGTCAGAVYVDACETGLGLGITAGLVLLGGLWFIGFVVGSVIWFATRPRP